VTDEAIRLDPYSREWPAMFEAERDAVNDAIGPWITGGIHHIGSTAIPGLSAKPIIDIQVGVADLECTRACIDVLADLEYQYAPYRTDEMHWFCKPDPSRRTHHLHLVPTDSARFRDTLAFRDYLRANRDTMFEYEAIKQILAINYEHDREAYTDGKAGYVRLVLRKARG
jgi:GrpB-like predicted nucleotidyltransferase (UPF0157 family)